MCVGCRVFVFCSITKESNSKFYRSCVHKRICGPLKSLTFTFSSISPYQKTQTLNSENVRDMLIKGFRKIQERHRLATSSFPENHKQARTHAPAKSK